MNIAYAGTIYQLPFLHSFPDDVNKFLFHVKDVSDVSCSKFAQILVLLIPQTMYFLKVIFFLEICRKFVVF